MRAARWQSSQQPQLGLADVPWPSPGIRTERHGAEALIQYRVAFEPDGRGLREVAEPTAFPHRHPSPQPFLSSLDETAWHPARRLAPYRPRRKREQAPQEPLFPDDVEASMG